MTDNEKKMQALSSLGITSTIKGNEFIVHTEKSIPADVELLQMYETAIGKKEKNKNDKVKAVGDAVKTLATIKNRVDSDLKSVIDAVEVLLNIK